MCEEIWAALHHGEDRRKGVVVRAVAVATEHMGNMCRCWRIRVAAV